MIEITISLICDLSATGVGPEVQAGAESRAGKRVCCRASGIQ